MLAHNESDESDGGSEAMVKREWQWLYLGIILGGTPRRAWFTDPGSLT